METNKDKFHKQFHESLPDEFFEHARAAKDEIHKSFEALFPPEFASHRRAAGKEMLLAIQKVIEQALEKLDDEPQEK